MAPAGGRHSAAHPDTGAPLVCSNQTRFDGVRPPVIENGRICPDWAAARLRCPETSGYERRGPHGVRAIPSVRPGDSHGRVSSRLTARPLRSETPATYTAAFWLRWSGAESNSRRRSPSCAAQDGAVILVAGEAGIGKTVFMQAVTEQAGQAGYVLATVGPETPATRTYAWRTRVSLQLRHNRVPRHHLQDWRARPESHRRCDGAFTSGR